MHSMLSSLRRFAAVALSLALVGALAGCDQSSNPTGPDLRQSDNTGSTGSASSALRADRTSEVVPDHYVIVFDDRVDDPVQTTRALQKQFDVGEVRHVYEHALSGFAAKLPEPALKGLSNSPLVDYIEPDRTFYTFAQETPTGIDRIEADANTTANIDGSDDRVDADIAILDTGIDLDHPDLNVHRSTDCTGGGPMNASCTDGEGDDGNGHGSHVAGTAAAIDDGEGVVGMAPGARLWAVKVLSDDGSGWMSDIIAGVDWVTDVNSGTSEHVEVANMSLGASGTWNSSLRDAIATSVESGTVYVVAAGNDAADVYGGDRSIGDGNEVIPAAYPEVAAISAMADSDGEPGGNGSDPSYNTDDSFAEAFSNYSEAVVSDNPVSSPGAAIDLLLPGVDIYSTYADGGYSTLSGTSMASPHGAGLAALHIAAEGLTPASSSDVAGIRQALIDEGIEQSSGDGLVTQNDPDGNEERLGWAATGGAPSVSWVNPSDGETVSGSVTIQIDASDAEDGDDALTVEWRIDGGSWREASFNSDTGYYEDAWDSSVQDDGDHTLDARATDSDGNSSTSGITVSTENTDDPPSVSWVNPSDGETVSGTITLEADASDDGNVDQVEFFVDGGSVGTDTDGSSGWTTDWNSEDVSDGDHNLTAEATDDAGQTASSSITVTVDNSTDSGDDAPTASIDGVSENNSRNPHAEFDVSWSAGDTDEDLDTVELTLYEGSVDGTEEDSGSIDVSGGSASGTTSLRAKHDDGSGNDYTVEIVVTDSNGNTASDTHSFSEDGS